MINPTGKYWDRGTFQRQDNESNIPSELALTPQSTQVGVKRHPQWHSSWNPNKLLGHKDYSHSDPQLSTPQTPSSLNGHKRGDENSSITSSRVPVNENQTCEQIEQTGNNISGLSNYLNHPGGVSSNLNRPLTQGEARHQRRRVTFNQIENQLPPLNEMAKHTEELLGEQYNNHPTQISLPPRNEEQIDFNSLRNPSTPKPILITPRQPKGTIPPTDPNPEGDPHPEGGSLQPKYFSGTLEGGSEENFHGYYFPPSHTQNSGSSYMEQDTQKKSQMPKPYQFNHQYHSTLVSNRQANFAEPRVLFPPIREPMYVQEQRYPTTKGVLGDNPNYHQYPGNQWADRTTFYPP